MLQVSKNESRIERQTRLASQIVIMHMRHLCSGWCKRGSKCLSFLEGGCTSDSHTSPSKHACKGGISPRGRV